MSLFRITCRFVTSQNYSSKIRQVILGGKELQQGNQWVKGFATKTDNFFLQNQIQKHHNYYQLSRNVSCQKKMNGAEGQRVVTHEITKNLSLISNKPQNVTLDPKTMKLKEPLDSPLVILFSWMLAKKKHLEKYAKIYTDQGFNVLTIELTPWQLLWPTKGSQLVADSALKFLENNTMFSPIIIHGFSVGGYMWGEMMAIMARDLPRYQPLLNKINAQIWDSAADITEIPVGVPKAIFGKNKTLENALRNYVLYHMKTFHDVATVHYIRSSQLFHFTLLKAPALFLVSKNDVVGAVHSNNSVKEDMESAGIKTTWKCWDKSPHVCHYQTYPEEYLSYVFKHLEDANVFERIAEKTRAKL